MCCAITTYWEQLEGEGWTSQLFPISEDGLAAWVDSIRAHASQVSTFWADDLAMRQAVTNYLHSNAESACGESLALE